MRLAGWAREIDEYTAGPLAEVALGDLSCDSNDPQLLTADVMVRVTVVTAEDVEGEEGREGDRADYTKSTGRSIQELDA